MSQKTATTDHPVMSVIAERWSPYAFGDRAVSNEDLRSLFEAARWAASSYNEQPWSYIVATKEDADAHARLLSVLVEANQEWAQAAPVLAIGVATKNFKRNDKPNKAAFHDLGQASAHIALEAMNRGLLVHQMIGIEPQKAHELYALPDDAEALTALAIGYAAAPGDAPEKLAERDAGTRSRKPLSEFVFSGRFGSAAVLT